MKKIFHFVQSNSLSGTENVVINICTMVKGYNYTYVSTKGPINNTLKYYGIKHIVIPKLSPFNIFKVIKKYKPDIVQANDLKVSLLLSLSGLYCHMHNIKMISELHSNSYKMRRWLGLRAIAYALVSFIYNDIVSVSTNILDDYPYSFLFKHKSFVIPNVVNPYRIKAGLLSNTRKVWDCMFLGRFADEKNPLRFVRIINLIKKRNASIKAIMVGTGYQLSSVKELINKLNLNRNINIVGFKSNPYKYLQQSKVLIVPSKSEGFCLVALESLIIGTPVITTPLIVLKKLLGHRCGIFAKNDLDFVNKILGLLCNKSKYNYIKKCGFKRIKMVNNINRFINNYRCIYH